ncbi:MAG: Hsp20/alpha crystallin family protein [bacterium]
MREEIFTKRSNDIEEEMRRLFSTFSQIRNGGVLRAVNVWHPPTDVCETDGEFCVICELAGVKKEDVRVHIDENVITISGIRHKRVMNERTIFHNLEINFGPFERNIRIPRKFVGSEPRANYSEGFLTLRIPVAEKIVRTEVDVKVE